MVTLQFIPHSEIGMLESNKKIRKILSSVKQDKILLIEGGLHPTEESHLIQVTMEQIDRKFKGIEICSVDDFGRHTPFWDKVKNQIANMLIGKKGGLTIVGPANIVKEIKKDPSKIELLMFDSKKKKVKRRR
jgi:uncharacterized protein